MGASICAARSICAKHSICAAAREELYHIESRSYISNLPQGKYIELCEAKHIDKSRIYMEAADEFATFTRAITDRPYDKA